MWPCSPPTVPWPMPPFESSRRPRRCWSWALAGTWTPRQTPAATASAVWRWCGRCRCGRRCCRHSPLVPLGSMPARGAGNSLSTPCSDHLLHYLFCFLPTHPGVSGPGAAHASGVACAVAGSLPVGQRAAGARAAVAAASARGQHPTGCRPADHGSRAGASGQPVRTGGSASAAGSRRLPRRLGHGHRCHRPAGIRGGDTRAKPVGSALQCLTCRTAVILCVLKCLPATESRARRCIYDLAGRRGDCVLNHSEAGRRVMGCAWLPLVLAVHGSAQHHAHACMHASQGTASKLAAERCGTHGSHLAGPVGSCDRTALP